MNIRITAILKYLEDGMDYIVCDQIICNHQENLFLIHLFDYGIIFCFDFQCLLIFFYFFYFQNGNGIFVGGSRIKYIYDCLTHSTYDTETVSYKGFVSDTLHNIF